MFANHFLHTLSPLNLKLTCERERAGNHPISADEKVNIWGDTMIFPRSQSQ